MGGTLVKVASAIHKVVKYYYHGPKWSSNKIQILKTKFEIGKKTNLTSLASAESHADGSEKVKIETGTTLCLRKNVTLLLLR